LAAPHPLGVDRQWRELVTRAAGRGLVSACLQPGQADLLLLCGEPAARALGGRLAGPLCLELDRVEPLFKAAGLRAAVQAIESAPVRAGRAAELLDWRWSTAWDRAGLRHLPGVGGADLRALLPHGGTVPLPAPAAPRRFPGAPLPRLAEVAALSQGLHPSELRAPRDPAAGAARRLALALALHAGWAEDLARTELGEEGPPTGGAALLAALRLLDRVLRGQLALARPMALPELARGRAAQPTAGPPAARLARRLALGG